MLEIDNCTINIGSKIIIENASFKAYPNAVTVISGESGAGKTTFLQTFFHAYNCKYIFQGKNIDQYSKQEREDFYLNNLSYVPQVGHFILGMKVSELVEENVRIGLMRDKELEGKLGLDQLMNKYPLNLSGGEKSRLSLYLHMMKQSPILICDEPTASLDRNYRKVVFDLLKDYAQKGRIVVCVSHDKYMIENADTLYQLENQQLKLICEKVSDQVENPNLTIYPKKYRIKYSHPIFHLFMLLILSLSIVGLIFASRLNYYLTGLYGSRLDDLTNNELLVYKSKYQGDKRYSYSGSEFPFSYNEKQKIRNVEHVTHVDERIDIDSHIQVIGDVIKMKGDISSLTLFENKLSQSIKDIAYLTTSYQPSSLKKKDILKEFQTNGVYINQQLYEQFPKLKESQSPNLTFYLNIPYANVDNVMEESVGNTDKMVKTNATGCIRIRTTLPVKGVIKSTSRFNYLQSLQETVYIDVKTYKKYVDKYRLQKPKIYYQYSKDNSYVEGYDIKREDLIKKRI